MRKHTHAVRRLLVATSAALLIGVVFAGTLSAHEHRHVGDYNLVVGFMNEPAIVEQPNGLDLRVTTGHGDNPDPVEGLANTLNAEIIFGDQRLPLEIRARWGQPGAYTADVIPTAIGTYTFRIYGTIEGMQVDETFVGGPDTFSEVVGRNAMTFPNQVSTVGSVQATASDASDTAGTAMTMAIVALVLGLLGAAIGGFALMKSMSRGREGTATSGAVAQDATD
jgi:hypothetical protein